MARRCLVPMLVIAAAAALATAATAHASSIVYIKGGDVWLAKPNGKSKVRITRDGTPRAPYFSPSQANDGTIVALRDVTLYSFRRNGRRVVPPRQWTFDPLPTLEGRPVGVALSPNGKLVATDFVLYEPGQFDPDCQCLRTQEIARYVDYANYRTEKTLAESQITGLDLGLPSWIDSSRVLMTTYGLFSPQVFVGTTSGGEPTAWYRDPEVNADLNTNDVFVVDGELSRAGDRLAVMRRPLGVDASDVSAGTIQILSVSNLTTPPTPRCTIGPGRRIGQVPGPTWSPDGRTLAWWEEGSGIYTTPVTSAADCGLKPRLIIRGAQEPDFGPANVPRRRR